MVLSPPESLLSYMVLQIIFPFLSCLSLFQPERINPELNQKGYSVKSDIWSLGITMVTYIIIAGYKVLSANPDGVGFGDVEANAPDTTLEHPLLSERAGRFPGLIDGSAVQWKPYSEVWQSKCSSFSDFYQSYDLQRLTYSHWRSS